MSSERGRRGAAGHASGFKCKTHVAYRLTCADFDALWQRSGGRCEACGELASRPSRELVIDHDHRYGLAAVRGLICRRCNAYLGQLEHPRIHPPFGRGPGRHFRNYLERSWFLARQESAAKPTPVPLDPDVVAAELSTWMEYNVALYSTRPAFVLVPLDKPARIARLLDERLSPQARGIFMRFMERLHRERQHLA